MSGMHSNGHKSGEMMEEAATQSSMASFTAVTAKINTNGATDTNGVFGDRSVAIHM
jgi:hypothetical protein